MTRKRAEKRPSMMVVPKSFTLLAPPPDLCPVCAYEHDDREPHNQESLYYQYRFYGMRGRWPTWADALAHCSVDVQRFWQQVLKEEGRWSEPSEGPPIADPPLESVHRHVSLNEYNEDA